MRLLWHRTCVFVLLGAGLIPCAVATRLEMSQRDAWREPDVQIFTGVVSDSRHDDHTAYHSVRITEVLKSTGDALPATITVVDPHFATTAAIPLQEGETVVLYATKKAHGTYESHGEIHLDAPAGADRLRGLRLFLRLMAVEDKARQRKDCVAAWNAKLSDPEKHSVLDAMWETRCPDYTDLLFDIAKGHNSPPIRSWAVTILASIEKTDRDAELIGLLDDPDYDVRRQLLVLFGAHNVKEAVPRIEQLLEEDLTRLSPSDADALREKAREALDRITGKDPSPYWKD